MPTKTIVYNSVIFTAEYVAKLSSLGYDAIEYRSGAVLECGLEKVVNVLDCETPEEGDFIPLARVTSLAQIAQLGALMTRFGDRLWIEIIFNSRWLASDILPAFTCGSSNIYISFPIDFIPAHTNQANFVCEQIRRHGFQARLRQDILPDNLTMAQKRHYENEFDIVLDNREKSNKIPKVHFSIVIPVYNNRDFVFQVLLNLKLQNRSDFEVVLCDDGSTDGLVELLTEKITEINFHLICVRLHRKSARSMGDLNYRAGHARNIGASLTRGEFLVFLDSDVLVSPEFLQTLDSETQDADLIMCQRLHIDPEASAKLPKYVDVTADQMMEVDMGYWLDFYKRGDRWNFFSDRWKYVCTHSLCLKRSLFYKVGGIAANFNVYGYEDVHLGYQVARVGGQFKLSSNIVYHLSPRQERSEYAHQHHKKLGLLAKSSQVFYLNTLDDEVFLHCKNMWNGSPLSFRFRELAIKLKRFIFKPNWS